MENINELSYKIIGCAYEVHRTLGVGLLESTYEACLSYEFDKAGIKYERQKELPVYYKEMKLDNGYRMDILVERQIVLELKSVEALLPHSYGSNNDLFKIVQTPFRTINQLQYNKPSKRN